MLHLSNSDNLRLLCLPCHELMCRKERGKPPDVAEKVTEIVIPSIPRERKLKNERAKFE